MSIVIPRANPIKKFSAKIYAHSKHFDWLSNFLARGQILEISVKN